MQKSNFIVTLEVKVFFFLLPCEHFTALLCFFPLSYSGSYKGEEPPWAPLDSLILLPSFLNSRLHLVMTSLPPVIMAGEQEVNQRSIISQPAPGSKGASHATTPSLLGPLPAWEPLTPQCPAASLWAAASVLCLCARSHLWRSRDEPLGAFLQRCIL